MCRRCRGNERWVVAYCAAIDTQCVAVLVHNIVLVVIIVVLDIVLVTRVDDVVSLVFELRLVDICWGLSYQGGLDQGRFRYKWGPLHPGGR